MFPGKKKYRQYGSKPSVFARITFLYGKIGILNGNVYLRSKNNVILAQSLLTFVFVVSRMGLVRVGDKGTLVFGGGGQKALSPPPCFTEQDRFI